MADSKSVKFQFSHDGLITKADPSLLRDGQYRNLTNLEAMQEGCLASRSGRKSLGAMDPSAGLLCYEIRKMVVQDGEFPSTPSLNPRYLGVQGGTPDLWRTVDYNTFTKVASSINTFIGCHTKGFSLASYSPNNSGGPWAFIASELKMLKDRGSNLYATLLPWGIPPAYGVSLVTEDGAGNLDGGDTLSPTTSTPYDYRYTYVESDTNDEGNPSQTMLGDSGTGLVGFSGDGLTYDGKPISVHLKAVKVLVQGTALSNIGTIKIYRRGGVFTDGAWRLVGSVDNPGSGNRAAFVDNAADTDIDSAPTLEFDNDPPVPSKPPTPITGSLAAIGSTGRQVVNLTLGTMGGAQPGTVLHLFYDNPEDVTIEQVISPTSFLGYFQHTHGANADFEIDTIANQPCHCATTYGQFTLVAGDPNNPHLIYRSKGDRPQAFSILPADGTVAVASAGTPANAILDMTDFRSQILTLNRYGMFETLIIQGSIVQPVQVANRGPVGKRAWCKTPFVEIWILSTDGVWSWDGGSFRKRTGAIDNLFRNEKVGALLPLDPRFWNDCVLESYGSEVHLIYYDTDGHAQRLICEPGMGSSGDRWRGYSITNPAITFIYTESDTGSMVEVRYSGVAISFALYDQQVVSGSLNLTSDYFTSDPSTQGNPIPFSVSLPWFDFGTPEGKKLLNEAFLDLDITGNPSGSSNLSIDILLDYSDVPVETLSVNLPLTGRSTIALVPGQSGADPDPIQTFGLEGRAFSFIIRGAAYPARMTFYALTFRYIDTGLQTGGAAGDWDSLGSKYDKKLYQFTVEFDSQGANQTILMDTITGREGKTYNPAVQSFVLVNPTIVGSGRAMKTFPVADGTIVKEVRLRTYSTSARDTAATRMFRVLRVDWESEPYPPDVVSYTPWDDGGLDYDKYCEQVTLSVNTNGVDVAVQVQADGVTVFAFFANGTDKNRHVNVTLPANLKGRQWRLLVDPKQAALYGDPNAIPPVAPGTGMFQLFSPKGIFRFQPADRGEVGHTFDWDDLGHPWDKYLISATIEWDNTGNADLVLQMDIKGGINGQTDTPDVVEFTLSGGRSKREFPLPANLIAKMIRIYPKASPAVGFKQWKYTIQKEDYPPDIILSTPWKDSQSPTDKNPSYLWLDMDSNGQACSVQLVNESGVALTVNHTGSSTDRKRTYAIAADKTGKMWRILPSPFGTAKSQIFNWGFERWHPWDHAAGDDPPDNTLWTPWRDAASPNLKNPSQLFVDMDTAGSACTVVLMNEIGAIVTVSHTGTTIDSKRNYPIPADQYGKRWRLLFTPAGKNKLYDWGLDRWHPWDNASGDTPPETTLWTPWQDAASPENKEPSNFFVDMDTGGVACSVDLVSESGTVATINHTGTATNRRQTYPLPADTKGNQWRLQLTPGGGGKSTLWNWGVFRWKGWDQAAQDDPPPVVLVTPWNDFGYPYEKIARNLVLTINTGGVEAAVHLQIGGQGTVATFHVISTYTDRRKTFSCPPDLIGTQWRLVIEPGIGGLSQMWDWTIDSIHEPATVSQWDSYEQTFGYKGWKLLKQGWWEYICSQPVQLQFLSDTGTFTVTLPAHATRGVERFPFDTEFGDGLNKSKIYRVKATSTALFKFYMQGSGIEFLPVGADRRSGYQQMTFAEIMGLGEAS